jgi:hypothetical protein
MRALKMIVLAGLMGLAGAAQAAPAYVDARLFPNQAAGWQRFLAVERALRQSFDNVCGDTFCEGEYSNLLPMRLRCSVHAASGVVQSCIWTFAGSAATVADDGRIDVDLRSFACPLPVAAGTRLEDFLRALEQAAPDRAIHVTPPGSRISIHEGLIGCL